jgi:GNAT superfamily N-acetyltransferase
MRGVPHAARGETRVKGIGNLTFRSDYWADPPARRAFKEFLLAIHGLDLTLWEEKGFWDENYRAFSLFDGDRVVSSVCLYSVDMTLAGTQCRVGQFSGVGTLPPYRRRGLARWLTQEALERTSAAHAGYFLFADDDALTFYQRCGFAPVAETGVSLAVVPSRPRAGLRKLDARDDRNLELIYRVACERSPVSTTLGAWNPKLLMFHCLYALRENVYSIDDLDVVVLFKTEGERLDLLDVVGRRVPSFAELHPYLARNDQREVRFHFVTDKLEITPTGRWSPSGNNAHIRGPFVLPGPERIFPATAHA